MLLDGETMLVDGVDGVGDLFLVVHPKTPPSDQDWDALMAIYRDRARALRGTAKLSVLVSSDGGGPDAKQRKRLAELGATLRVAVLSASPVVRAIGTAARWFNPELRVLAPDDLESARQHLGIAPERWSRAIDRLDRLLTTFRERARSTGT